MNSLCDTWGVDQTQILPTATRFFNEYKRLSTVTKKQDQQILNLQVQFVLNKQGDEKIFFTKSDQESPTLYFSFLPQFAHKLKETEKGLIFVGGNYILGLIGTNKVEELVKDLEAVCKEVSSKPVKMTKKNDVKFDFKIKGQKPVVTKEICQFNITGADFKFDKINEVLVKHKITDLE